MKHRILVVEDDPPMALLLKKILAKQYEVVVASNGLNAIHWLSTGNYPHLILTDLNMPVLSGEELITNLKKSGLYRRIPVIILTANNEKSAQEKFTSLGCIDYLLKPFEPTVLRHKVHQVIGCL
ncbi:response regulator (plasmid) [Flammeovirgaceae bacterium SG7u.111]|nr:response regulator [Flammeovirgaceae bacterium SG7u.132]WPO38822.1 response regulator [Flammeovirgaceae bacterium SG7u.111]